MLSKYFRLQKYSHLLEQGKGKCDKKKEEK